MCQQIKCAKNRNMLREREEKKQEKEETRKIKDNSRYL